MCSHKSQKQAMRPSLRAPTFDTIAEQLRRLVPGSAADRREIADSIDLVERIALTIRGGASMSERQAAEHRIGQALRQRKFISLRSIQGLYIDSLQLCFPGSDEVSGVEHWATSREDQFRLDMSLMLVQRELTWEEPRIRMAWADSSPQGPFDWFLWRYVYVLLRDLWEATAAAVTLMITPGGVLADRGMEDDPDLPDFEQPMHTDKRRDANRKLEALVKEHLNVPIRAAHLQTIFTF